MKGKETGKRVGKFAKAPTVETTVAVVMTEGRNPRVEGRETARGIQAIKQASSSKSCGGKGCHSRGKLTRMPRVGLKGRESGDTLPPASTTNPLTGRIPGSRSTAPGNDTQAEKYRTLREQRLATLSAVLWDEESGAWFDYDLDTGKKNKEFYPSNLTPLWAGCFSDSGVADKALKYLEDSHILTYQHGIPTSLQKTGQQWDFPNAWAPLQDVVIRGLAKSPSPRAQEVAFQLAQNWIRTNFDGYSQKSAMYEKYDISNGGQPGGGGEYDVQEGFGWTNGVVLMLLDRYGDRLTSGAQLAFLEPHCLLAALLLNFLLSLLPR
ncbi:trehalase-like [Microcebus murinus]|uniref:trehalase-like n=1 Tax=Microcebus murinus TaxID=30608 RepID=UPI003F6CB4FF